MHNLEDGYVCLIPKPASISRSSGNFVLSRDTKIIVQKDNPEIISIAELLASYLKEISGYKISVSDTNDTAGNIQLALNNILE